MDDHNAQSHSGETAPTAGLELSAEAGVDWLRLHQRWLWAVAVIFYGVGDLVTTVYGLGLGQAAEAGPLAAAMVNAHGLEMIVVLKAAAMAVFVGAWEVTSEQRRVAIPLALAVVGVGVTGWNLLVLLVA